MSLFDSIRSKLTDAKSALETEVTKFKNKDILEALVAASTLVAAADGVIDASEKAKMVGVLKNSPLTGAYPVDQVIKSFNGHADRFDFDLDVGRSEALRVIGKFRSNPDVARMIVRSAVVIGKADGNFDPSEKKAVEMIARELGVDPSEFLN
nr:tellurite resistance TerB family protein [Sphingomonas populi]